MSQKNVKNIAASIKQKLLNKSKEMARPFSEVLQYYGLERFLYRISASKYQNNFTLKGALLFTAWRQSAIRSTVDIDLLGKVSNNPDDIVKIFQDICNQKTEDDGLRFDDSSIVAEQITLDADYQGVRVLLYGYLDTARIRIQVDIGFSDVITPDSEVLEYPTILDMPVPKLNCYNKETAIAEKLQAMVKLDLLNSRMKDIYDIWILSQQFELNNLSLANAIQNTFEQRKTKITTDITTFTEEFYLNDEKIAQWKGFLKRSKVTGTPIELEKAVLDIKSFLLPILTKITQKDDIRKN